VIVRRDDTGIAPDVAKRQAQELIVQDGVDILAGTTVTPNAISVGDVSTQSKKPFPRFQRGDGGHHCEKPVRLALGAYEHADHRAAGKVRA